MRPLPTEPPFLELLRPFWESRAKVRAIRDRSIGGEGRRATGRVWRGPMVECAPRDGSFTCCPTTDGAGQRGQRRRERELQRAREVCNASYDRHDVVMTS